MNQYLKKDGNIVIQIGKNFGHLSQSVFLEEIYSIKDGPPPEVNLSNEKNNGLVVFKLINDKLVSSVHDISSGGLLLALTEMTFKSSYGIKINKPKNLSNLMEYYFSEDQGRYLIEVEPINMSKVNEILNKNNVYNESVGVVQENYFEISEEFKIKTNELYEINNTWYNNY